MVCQRTCSHRSRHAHARCTPHAFQSTERAACQRARRRCAGAAGVPVLLAHVRRWKSDRHFFARARRLFDTADITHACSAPCPGPPGTAHSEFTAAAAPAGGHGAAAPGVGHGAPAPTGGHSAAPVWRSHGAAAPVRGHDAAAPTRRHSAGAVAGGHSAAASLDAPSAAAHEDAASAAGQWASAGAAGDAASAQASMPGSCTQCAEAGCKGGRQSAGVLAPCGEGAAHVRCCGRLCSLCCAAESPRCGGAAAEADRVCAARDGGGPARDEGAQEGRRGSGAAAELHDAQCGAAWAAAPAGAAAGARGASHARGALRLFRLAPHARAGARAGSGVAAQGRTR
jgi:hypothetical protein